MRQATLILKEEPISLIGPDGVARSYTIRQLDGAGRDKFNNFQRERFEWDENLQRNVCKDHTDIHAHLIAMMLWRNDTKQLVPIEEIRAWPDMTQQEVYSWCTDIAENDGKGEEKAKND